MGLTGKSARGWLWRWPRTEQWLGVVLALTLGSASCTVPAAPAPVAIPAPSSIAAGSGTPEVALSPFSIEATPTGPEDRGPAASAELYGTPVLTAPVPTATVPATAVPPLVPALRVPPMPEVPVPASRPSTGPRQRTIVLDPGHGGPEVGPVGAGLAEKTANLQITFRLQRLLEEQGWRVMLTRDSDRRAYTLPEDQATTPRAVTRADLQARIDLANAVGADVFISIHNNGSTDSSQSGTEVWVDPTRPFGHLSVALAQEVLDALVAEIRTTGYPGVNRGLKDASQFRVFQGQTFPIFVLGRPRASPTPTRATGMPGILGETLFLTNPVEAALLQREAVQEAIARGYRNGVVRYFQRLDAGELGLPYP